MSTEKLYYQDAYLRSFTATVLRCTSAKGGYVVVLDRTAFYPEGGGQPCDFGTLGGLPVTGVHERGGEVEHFVPGPLTPGDTVTGEIDFARRFDLMQQHSGEHIVSGLICAQFGCDNVGFHIGAERVTIDFNVEIDARSLAEIERRANEYIWENHETEIFFPTPEALAALPYRSKKELEGEVRIVRFPGADTCACCGTHVARSGEVGLVKLLDHKRFREGVRIEMLCGGRAKRYFDEVEAQNRGVSVLLSAKPLETAEAVKRLAGEAEALRYRLYGMEQAQFARTAQALSGAGDVLLFCGELSADAVRRLAAAVSERCGGICALFSGESGAYKYAIGMPDGDLRGFVGEMNAALSGRGGGKNGFAQGSASASRAEVEAFFAAKGILPRSADVL